MEIITIISNHKQNAAIVKDNRVYSLKAINSGCQTAWPLTLETILQAERFEELLHWYNEAPEDVWEKISSETFETVKTGDLIHERISIWGIGFNYQPIDQPMPEEKPAHPVSFVKPWNTLAAKNDSILLPKHSATTTGEGEIALIIKKRCRNVRKADALSCIAGFTTALDMTEADIHSQNPRFLARAKSFDTFCALGSTLLSTDRFQTEDRTIRTVLNGKTISENRTDRMLMDIQDIVAYFSKETTLYPGDVILTGTPGPVKLEDGDTLSAEVTGLRPLVKTIRKESSDEA